MRALKLRLLLWLARRVGLHHALRAHDDNGAVLLVVLAVSQTTSNRFFAEFFNEMTLAAVADMVDGSPRKTPPVGVMSADVAPERVH